MTTKRDMFQELHRTRPDYVVYAPGSFDGSTGDTGNEHFHVFDGPDGSLMAVWTQSTCEGRTDQRIVFARSTNGGCTWTTPRVIAGGQADPATGKGMCSWQFAITSQHGRLYVLYNRHIGVNDIFAHTTGLMGGKFSDDNGQTWSAEEIVPMPRTCWDNPDPAIPGNWIVWQKPKRLSAGKYYAGFTRWVSPVVKKSPLPHWWACPSVVSFFRVENLDDQPPVAQLQFRYFHDGATALQAMPAGHPDKPVIQEPSLVKLPDGRLFCVMRTPAGSPYWSVSTADGQTWAAAQPLLYHDNGPCIAHPCSPCPIYPHAAGGYFLLVHCHDGHFGPWTPAQSLYHRRPIYLLRGEFTANARQPVSFSGPKLLMDNDGIPLGHGGGRVDLAMYASVTHQPDSTTLWYPDRKFFLLGKRIPREFLADMEITHA